MMLYAMAHARGLGRSDETVRAFGANADRFHVGVAALGSKRSELMDDNLGLRLRDQLCEPHGVVHVANHLKASSADKAGFGFMPFECERR